MSGSRSPPRLHPRVEDRLEDLFREGTVSRRDVDDRNLESLSELSPREAIDALDRLQQGMQGGRVRNPAAYLAGVLRRGSRRNDPPPSSSRHEEDQSRNSDSADPLSLITPGAVAKLREVGVLSGPNSLDDRSLGTLVRLPPEVQFLVADTFTKRRLEGIRSMSAYFASHVSSVERDVGVGRLQPPTPTQLDAIEDDLLRGRRSYRDARDASPGYGHRDRGSVPSAAQSTAAVPPGLKHHGLEQLEWGVRVDEFHGLSPLAQYVHPAAALKLQQLWDSGNRLVSLLDDDSWERLARLDAQAAVPTVNEAAEALRTLPPGDLAAANAAFVTIASRRRVPEGGMPPPHYGGSSGVAPQSAGANEYPTSGRPPPYTGGGPPQQISSRGGATQSGGLAGAVTSSFYSRNEAVPSKGLTYGSAASPIYSSGPAARLSPAIQQQLAEVVATSRGLLRPEHFNDGLVDMLLEMGDAGAIDFLGRLGARDLSQVRNMPGYIYGALRKIGPPQQTSMPPGRADLSGTRQLAAPRYRPY